MSHAVSRPDDAPAMAAPTSAPVFDYRCLFTHDLRRKQKRWQDGRLKYHTFNRRVMVYDDGGNLVGDAHAREGPLMEGDEMELENGAAAMVQVCECVGVRQQDLSGLVDKRAREVSRRAAAATPNSRSTLQRMTPARGLGRAVIPDRSPFEQRRTAAAAAAARAGEMASPMGAKRRRRSVSPPSRGGFAKSLFGTRLTLSADFPMKRRAGVKVKSRDDGSARLREEMGKNGRGADTIHEDGNMAVKHQPPIRKNSAEKMANASTGAVCDAIRNNDDDITVLGDLPPRREKKNTTEMARGPNGPFANMPRNDDEDVMILDGPPRVREKLAERSGNALVGPLAHTVHDEDKMLPLEQSRILDETLTKSKQILNGPVAHNNTMARDQPRGKTLEKSTHTSNGPVVDVDRAASIHDSRQKAKPRRNTDSDVDGLPLVIVPSTEPAEPLGCDDAECEDEGGKAAVDEAQKATPDIRQSDEAQAIPDVSETDGAQDNRVHATTYPQMAPTAGNQAQAERGKETTLPDAGPLPSKVGRRAELRIRSRQRRGLMLMSDQQGQSRQSSPVRNRLSTKVARSPQTHRAVLDEQHVRQTETRSPCRAAPSSSADSSSESDVIAVHRRRKRGFVDVSSSDDDFPPLHRDLSSDDASPPLHRDLSSDDTPPTPKRPARNSRRCGDSRSTTASGRGRQKLQSKGPRIERLARKSTKSKEIFGFLSSAEAEAVVPTAFAMTSNWSAFGSCPRAGLEDVARVVNGGKGEARTRDVDDRDETTREGRDRDETKIRRASAVAKPAEAQIPNRQASDSSGRLRIANPATRGKKAARREHAMGRAPQPLVPLASADPARAQPAAVTITVLEPEEERGGLPGFSRANGGAWGLTGRTGHEGDTAPSTRIRE